MALCLQTSPGKRGCARVPSNNAGPKMTKDGEEGLAGDRAEQPERRKLTQTGDRSGLVCAYEDLFRQGRDVTCSVANSSCDDPTRLAVVGEVSKCDTGDWPT